MIRIIQVGLVGLFILTAGISYFSGVPDNAGLSHPKVYIPSGVVLAFLATLAYQFWRKKVKKEEVNI